MDRQIGQVPRASFPVNGQVILDLVSTVLASCRSELFRHGLSSKAARIFPYLSVSSRQNHVTLKIIINEATKRVHHSKRLGFSTGLTFRKSTTHRKICTKLCSLGQLQPQLTHQSH